MCRYHEDEWVIGKGNGLSYTTHSRLLTSLVNSETWGGLSLDNALRDFDIGNEVRRLGIKTNRMHCVLSLDKTTVQNGEEKQAALLQYSVECPYRISDIGFMPKSLLVKTVQKWGGEGHCRHLRAADILVGNLRVLHDHHIMHNAMHPQNYTWALELLDFEVSRSDNLPYASSDYESFVPMLIEAEVIQTYEIINFIAWCLEEQPDDRAIEKIFSKHNFDLIIPPEK